MKKFTVVLVQLFVMGSIAFAARQDKIIKGRVVDAESGEALEWVTVAVRNAEGVIVDGTTSDANGAFSLKLGNGTEVFAAMIGYKDAIIAPSAEMLIALEADAEQLEAASVTGKRMLIETKIDKVVLNVSKSPMAQSSNGLDLIKKAPGVVIDKDGNITLNGKKVTVWIDGRPSYMDGKSLEALLRSTNGGSIDKFEIMEHPSAKYDAAGQGGIINIKTKKNSLQGFSGELGFNTGGMYYDQSERFILTEGTWGNFSYRTAKTNSFLNLYQGIYDYDYAMDIVNDSYFDGITFNQHSTSFIRNTFKNWHVKFGNDWFINKKNTLGFILNFPGQTSDSWSEPKDNETLQTIAGILTRKDVTKNNENSDQLTYSANINYTHIFDESRNSEMTVNADYYKIDGNVKVRQDIYTEFFTDKSLYNSSRHLDTDNVIDIYSIKSDYQTLLWQKVMFESGLKYALSSTGNTGSQIMSSNIAGEGGVVDNNFRYDEHVAAAYVDAATSFGKFSLKAGLRAEYTGSHGDWQSARQSSDTSYVDIFPTVFIGYNPNQNWRMGASYSRRINRAGYYFLNPTPSYIDAHTWVEGNPKLQPQYSDDVNAFVGYGQHLNLAIGYDFTSNWQTQQPFMLKNGDQFFRWANFGTNETAYLSLSISSLPITKWLDWTLNTNGVYMATSAYDVKHDTECLFAQVYSSLSFNLPADWDIEVDGKFTSPIKLGYMTTSPQWESNMVIKKLLLDKRLSVSLTVQDIFRSQNLDFSLSIPGGSEVLTMQRFLNQKVLLSMNWNFGSSKSPARKRKVGNLDELSRTSGSGGLGR